MAEEPDGSRPLEPDELVAGLGPALAERPTGLMLAVSGGPDSVALMHLAAAARDRLPPLGVATVDHGLRAGSADEAARVIEAAARLGLPAFPLAWPGPKPARGIPARAREARYDLLAACCRRGGASHLVTAHQRDDQAETVLLRLARGSGPAGLAAMRPLLRLAPDLALARPLLAVPRSRLLATCAARGWAYDADPSNRDLRFTRPRLRRLAPLLAAEGLDSAALLRLAARAGRAEDALRAAEVALAAALLRHDDRRRATLDLRALGDLPAEWTVRLLARAVAQVGGGRAARLERCERAAERLGEAVRNGADLSLTLGGALLRLDRDGRLVVTPEPARHRGASRSPRREGAPCDAPPSLGNAGAAPYIAR